MAPNLRRNNHNLKPCCVVLNRLNIYNLKPCCVVLNRLNIYNLKPFSIVLNRISVDSFTEFKRSKSKKFLKSYHIPGSSRESDASKCGKSKKMSQKCHNKYASQEKVRQRYSLSKKHQQNSSFEDAVQSSRKKRKYITRKHTSNRQICEKPSKLSNEDNTALNHQQENSSCEDDEQPSRKKSKRFNRKHTLNKLTNKTIDNVSDELSTKCKKLLTDESAGPSGNSNYNISENDKGICRNPTELSKKDDIVSDYQNIPFSSIDKKSDNVPNKNISSRPDGKENTLIHSPTFMNDSESSCPDTNSDENYVFRTKAGFKYVVCFENEKLSVTPNYDYKKSSGWLNYKKKFLGVVVHVCFEENPTQSEECKSSETGRDDSTVSERLCAIGAFNYHDEEVIMRSKSINENVDSSNRIKTENSTDDVTIIDITPSPRQEDSFSVSENNVQNPKKSTASSSFQKSSNSDSKLTVHNDNVETLNKNSEYYCVHCYTGFLNRKDNYNHVCDGKIQKGFLCVFCEKIFNTYNSFKCHKELHFNE